VRNNGISNPQRLWINYAPMPDRYMTDRWLPEEDSHAFHLHAIDTASAGYGYPVAPRLAASWPPTRDEAIEHKLRKVMA
jgi:hypothetical protein